MTKGDALVYCGPSVRGVAKQYTVFSGGLPREVEEFREKHPLINDLIVPVEDFPEMRKKIETPGTRESLVYRNIKSEIL